MAKLTLTDIASGFQSNTVANANNTLIETAIENTLSRDGTSPNIMLANLDMNNHALLNVSSLNGLDGTLIGDIAAQEAAALAAQTAAETAQGLAEVAKAAADADVVLTHADVVLTHADVVSTHADVSLTHADVVSAEAAKTAAEAAVLGDIAAATHIATSKTPPVGNDEIPIWDSISSALRKVTFTNLVSYLSGLCSAGWNAATSTLAATATSVVSIGDAAAFDARYASKLTPPYGYIEGLTMSTAGGSSTLSVAAGSAANHDNTRLLNLASAINKTTAAWAVGSGNGGLDTGTIANGFYYFYLIYRSDTGVSDVIFTLSSAAPALPANYTHYRYIGAAKNTGGTWDGFLQIGRDFLKSIPVLDYATAGSGTTSTLLGVSAPLGRRMKLRLSVIPQQLCYLITQGLTDMAPSTTVAPLASTNGMNEVWSNTNAQFYFRTAVSGTLYISLHGWTDPALD